MTGVGSSTSGASAGVGSAGTVVGSATGAGELALPAGVGSFGASGARGGSIAGGRGVGSVEPQPGFVRSGRGEGRISIVGSASASSDGGVGVAIGCPSWPALGAAGRADQGQVNPLRGPPGVGRAVGLMTIA